MRELAFMQWESEGTSMGDPDALAEFDAEVQLASEGRFEELDIDSRPLPGAP